MFNGLPFNGWQKQVNAIGVQNIIEKKISLICKQNIEITGCGRTDTGVHSQQFFFHFDIEELPFSPEKFRFKLNALLPKSIGIIKIFRVEPDAHARFSATKRTYKYFFHLGPNPFLEGLSTPLIKHPNLELLNKGAKLLIGKKDFSSFCKSGSANQNNICEVYEAYWEFKDNQFIFTISANRFLRNMVRAIAGTLLDIGYQKTALENLNGIIELKQRSASGKSTEPQGLYLWQIDYPFLKNKNE
jgi:tRNA pseudouridine38-40 synthase